MPQIKRRQISGLASAAPFSEEERNFALAIELSRREAEERQGRRESTDSVNAVAMSEDESNLARVLEISRREEELRRDEERGLERQLQHERHQEESVKDVVSAAAAADDDDDDADDDFDVLPVDVDLTGKDEEETGRGHHARGGARANRKHNEGDQAAEAAPLTSHAVTFVSKSDAPLRSRYDLKCVVRHLGRAAFAGHYNTDVRGSTSATQKKGCKKSVFNVDSGSEEEGVGGDAWSRFDDSSVQAGLSQASVLEGDKNQRSAYLLFYVQRDP